LIPSVLGDNRCAAEAPAFTHTLSLGLSVLLIVIYALGLVFLARDPSRNLCRRRARGVGDVQWPMSLALLTLAGVTILVALVSEIFVESVQQAAKTLGLSPAFVGSSSWRWSEAPPCWFRRCPRAQGSLGLSVGIALGAPFRLRVRRADARAAELCDRPGADGSAFLAWSSRYDADRRDDGITVTNSGRSAWFLGALVVTVISGFCHDTLLLPPRIG